MADKITPSTKSRRKSFLQLLPSSSSDEAPKVRTLAAGSKKPELPAKSPVALQRIFHDVFGSKLPAGMHDKLDLVNSTIAYIEFTSHDDPAYFNELHRELGLASHQQTNFKAALDDVLAYVSQSDKDWLLDTDRKDGLMLLRVTLRTLTLLYQNAHTSSEDQLDDCRRAVSNTLGALDTYLWKTASEPNYANRSTEDQARQEKTSKPEKKEKAEKKQEKKEKKDEQLRIKEEQLRIKQEEKEQKKVRKAFEAAKALAENEKKAEEKAARKAEKEREKAAEKAALKQQRRSMKFGPSDGPGTPGQTVTEDVPAPATPRQQSADVGSAQPCLVSNAAPAQMVQMPAPQQQQYVVLPQAPAVQYVSYPMANPYIGNYQQVFQQAQPAFVPVQLGQAPQPQLMFPQGQPGAVLPQPYYPAQNQ